MFTYNSVINYVALKLYLIFAAVGGIIGVVLYILRATGIYKMAKSSEINGAWVAFVPFANVYIFGKIAEKYKNRDGSKSAKFSIILIFMVIALLIITVTAVIFSAVAVNKIVVSADYALQNDFDMAPKMLSSLVSVIGLGLLLCVVALIYKILYYVALGKIFYSFDCKNATVFIILSVLFNFMESILLFIIRKNKPCFEYGERLGFYSL